MSTTEMPITDKIRAEVEAEIKAIYEAKWVKEVADIRQKLTDQNEIAIQKAIEELRAELKPPSKEDISQLLSQEYLEFKVDIPWSDPPEGSDANLVGSEAHTRTFVIRELGQSKEKAFYKKLKEQIIPRAADIGSLTFELLEGDTAKKIISAIETFEPAFDLMADACMMLLDPKGKEKLTLNWIQDNLSSYRQWNIINAQLQVNRLRDFFSQVSRGSGTMKTNLGVATPNLPR